MDALLSNRVLRQRSADVSAESALHGAWASASLAGAEYELADVRSGEAAGDAVVQGALRAQSAIGELADTWRPAPRQVLARLHALAAADLAPPDELGRPRPGTADRLDMLAQLLALTSAPAVVVAGVVHGEILGRDAFEPVSGIVARAAARLTLIDRGLDPKSLVVLEAGHRDQGGTYLEALEAYQSGTQPGIARWLVHCADAVVAGAQEAAAICEAITRG